MKPTTDSAGLPRGGRSGRAARGPSRRTPPAAGFLRPSQAFATIPAATLQQAGLRAHEIRATLRAARLARQAPRAAPQRRAAKATMRSKSTTEAEFRRRFSARARASTRVGRTGVRRSVAERRQDCATYVSRIPT